MESVIRQTRTQKNNTSRKRKANVPWKIASISFSIQKYYTWQNNTFWCGIISAKNTMQAGPAERSIK